MRTYMTYIQAINPMEMLMEALSYIQKRFYEDFPPHPDEAKYGFVTCSTIKPTQVRTHACISACMHPFMYACIVKRVSLRN